MYTENDALQIAVLAYNVAININIAQSYLEKDNHKSIQYMRQAAICRLELMSKYNITLYAGENPASLIEDIINYDQQLLDITPKNVLIDLTIKIS